MKVIHIRVTITIPAFNEEKTIGNLIRDIKHTMNKTKHKYEILVVDDGSTDKTAQTAKKAGALVHSHPYNYGLAETFRTEMEKALERKNDVIIHIDADYQYIPKEIPNLIKPIEKGEADIVLGSRFAGTIESMPWLNRWGNRAFSRVVSNISKLKGENKITDAQTGFRAFRREFAEKVKIVSTHTYTQEMIIRAVREKFRIKEVPVYFAKRHGKSKLISSPLGYAARAWINIFRVYRDYEPLKFFGSIGAILMGFGGLGVLYILALLATLGLGIADKIVPFAVLILLLLVSGLQILFFAFLADKSR